MGTSSDQPTATVAGLALAVAILLATVVSLSAVILKMVTGNRLVEAVTAGGLTFSTALAVTLPSLTALGLLQH